MVVLAAIAIAASLFSPWHEVHAPVLVDPDALFGALYMGPDYDPPPDARAAMLDRSIATRSRTCTGLEHLGIEALVTAFVVALAGIAAAAWPSRGSAAHVAAITGLVALAHVGACMLGSFLPHLLDLVGPESPASHAFTVAQLVLVLATASLVPLAIVEARRATRDPTRGT
jgi:hypothetical protein